MKRRTSLKTAGALTGGTLLSFLSLQQAAYSKANQDIPVKIVVAGGHPDDPETGCGGTIAWFASLGHEVTILYLTTGEAGIPGTGHEEAAAIREKEAREASGLLGAKPVFFRQIDGDTYINQDSYQKMHLFLEGLDPGLIFTQWPVDTHRDHRAASLLIYDTWLAMKKKIPLYYYEVMTGIQTQAFNPTDYVDITDFAGLKKEASYAHKSQKPEEWYREHEEMSLFRGKEAGCRHAEAFVGHPHNRFLI